MSIFGCQFAEPLITAAALLSEPTTIDRLVPLLMRCFILASIAGTAMATTATQVWEFNAFGTIINHACGLSECGNESSYLEEQIQSSACSTNYARKVTLVTDGGNINDGTFNQLAYNGAIAACTDANNCCMEVDRVDDDHEDHEVRFMCELEYAAVDSGLSIGVGFLHEQSIHRAGTCRPDKKFAVVDVAYFDENAASNANIMGLTFADDQAGYLAGVIAGGVAAQGNGKVGVIGGLPIAPVERFINGFSNGVLYACPTCVTEVIYCPFGGAAETVTGSGYMCPGEFADIAFGVNSARSSRSPSHPLPPLRPSRVRRAPKRCLKSKCTRSAHLVRCPRSCVCVCSPVCSPPSDTPSSRQVLSQPEPAQGRHLWRGRSDRLEWHQVRLSTLWHTILHVVCHLLRRHQDRGRHPVGGGRRLRRVLHDVCERLAGP